MESMRTFLSRILMGGVLLGVHLLLPALVAAESPTFTQDEYDFFERDIRPVLIDNCVECHGPDLQRNGLRLDSLEAVLKGGSGGPVLTPGEPHNSLILEVIRQDSEIKMPPSGSLTEETQELIAHWIALGAPWPEGPALEYDPDESWQRRMAQASERHWAFQPVADPPLPEVAQTDWPQSPVDHFILARLEEAKLTPSEPADRRTLLRRVTFDLTGLPPTPEELAGFEADTAPDAFARVVERLLDSPRYGERWARYWLDVARYADSKGYVFQEERDFAYSHTYRDYVIRAFNEDLPYDRFIREQIAADQLELADDKRPLAAMGFLTLGRRFINNVHDITDDRIDVVTRGMLGLTVSCARCHDHKYDPISIGDYYSLYGVFRSSVEPPEPPLIKEPDEEDPDYQDYLKSVAEREAELERFRLSLHVDLITHAREKAADYMLAAHLARDTAEEDEFQKIARDRELRWQLLRKWVNFLQEHVEKETPDPVFGVWTELAAFTPENFATAAAEFITRIADDAALGFELNPRVARAFAGEPPASMEVVAERYRAVFQDVDRMWTDKLAAHTQIAARGGHAGAVLPDALPDVAAEAVRLALYAPESPANVPEGEIIQLSDVPTQGQVRQRRNAVDRVKATHPGRPDRAHTLVDADKPFDPHIFERGQPALKGDSVPRQFLTVLSDGAPQPFEQGSGRLELAEAIADPDNPLTARVMVNRIWMHHFGKPLVDTPSDFGLRSAPPTHPELLDYLATRFVESGWSIKELHRKILLSSAYQQDSLDREHARERDPENTLVWRQNRQRLDFEAFRDALLASAGTLDLSMGGPSVDITTEPPTTRRTVYAFIERQNLPSLFHTFDFAIPDTHSPRRFRTTVPQQALYMMNSPFIAAQARALAAQIKQDAEAASPQLSGEALKKQRVKDLYQRLFQRAPDAGELALALDYLAHPVRNDAAAPVWEYGYGALDPGTEEVAFTPLPHWTGATWAGGPDLPDPELGWVNLSANGGHPGDPGFAAIRRWTAPRSGTLSIASRLRHGNEQGDGVQGYIVSSRAGVLWHGAAFNSVAEAHVDTLDVEAGEVLDFLVDCGETTSFDNFAWNPRITYAAPDELRLAADSAERRAWHAATDFRGPQPPPLDPWEKYAQILLSANEFAFVD